jgi:hypothetical protein
MSHQLPEISQIKRSTDYDNKGPGKAAREEQIAKLKEKGTIPRGWGA